MLFSQNCHDPVIVPCTINADRFRFGTFVGESAGAVATDSAHVVGQNAQVDPLQSHDAEGVIEREFHGSTPDAVAQMRFTKQIRWPDGRFGHPGPGCEALHDLPVPHLL